MKEVKVNVLRLIVGGKKFKYGDLIDIDKYPDYYALFSSFIDERKVIPTKNFHMLESNICMIPNQIKPDNTEIISELKSTMLPIHDTLKEILIQLKNQPTQQTPNLPIEELINVVKSVSIPSPQSFVAAPSGASKTLNKSQPIKKEPVMKEFIPDFNTNQLVSSNVNAKTTQTQSNVMDAVSALRALKQNNPIEDLDLDDDV